MSVNFQDRRDLLGDPIPENWGKRGRPPHIPTYRNRNKVRLLLAGGWTRVRIARALRITQETLRKHYFAELRQADEAKDALVAEHKMLVFEAAQGGNVGAMRLLWQMIERDELDLPKPSAKKEPKPKPLGKKEQAEIDAQKPTEGWGEVLH